MDKDANTDNKPENKQEDARDKARKNLGDPKNIEEMRIRLYSRGTRPKKMGRTPFIDTTKPVPKTWNKDNNYAKKTEEDIIVDMPPASRSDIVRSGYEPSVPETHTMSEAEYKNKAIMNRKKKRQSYRFKAILTGIVFFVLALIISSFFLFFGGNTISGNNISIDISPRPLNIAGGEEFDFQVAVSNQNSVSIESATLIIDYTGALGTQSADNIGKELFSERKQLNNIDTGEVINIPVKAIFFGEENEEKVVAVSIEYRVSGSNAIFFKEAEPLRLKISSSPIILRVDSVESISSGQEIEFKITVESNSSTVLKDVLVKASYPYGFDFVESDIETASGQDTWLIESIEPEEKYVINIKGVVVGKQDEERTFVFSSGMSNERDKFNLTSIFSKVTAEVVMEQPFLNIGVNINGKTDEEVVINLKDDAKIVIAFNNFQEEAIYDGVITVKLGGNALNEFEVYVQNGFYDSNTNTVTWDYVETTSLSEILPGSSSQVKFSLIPKENISRTPEVTMEVAVKGQRVFADRVPQELVGSVFRKLRVESLVSVVTSAHYSTGVFTNTGPIPPVAEQITQYTIVMSAQNGSNDITNVDVTAILPQYMIWLDLKTPGDVVTYDSATRVVRWNIGDMDANSSEDVSIQVSLRPSLSQVDTSPTILGEQRFKATDRFTGTTLRTISPAITTKLFSEFDEIEKNGRVQAE